MGVLISNMLLRICLTYLVTSWMFQVSVRGDPCITETISAKIGGACYWITQESQLTQTDGQTECCKSGGHLAEIIDNYVLHQLYNLAVAHLVNQEYKWIGYYVDPSTVAYEDFILLDGRPQTYKSFPPLNSRKTFPRDYKCVALLNELFFPKLCNESRRAVCTNYRRSKVMNAVTTTETTTKTTAPTTTSTTAAPTTTSTTAAQTTTSTTAAPTTTSTTAAPTTTSTTSASTTTSATAAPTTTSTTAAPTTTSTTAAPTTTSTTAAPTTTSTTSAPTTTSATAAPTTISTTPAPTTTSTTTPAPTTTSTTSTTTTTATTTGSEVLTFTTASKNCYYAYLCKNPLSLHNDTEKLKQRLLVLRKTLQLQKHSLSSAKRKKISAADDRPSAAKIGYFGAVIIGSAILVIVFLDVIKLCRCADTHSRRELRIRECYLNDTQMKPWHAIARGRIP